MKPGTVVVSRIGGRIDLERTCTIARFDPGQLRIVQVPAAAARFVRDCWKAGDFSTHPGQLRKLDA